MPDTPSTPLAIGIDAAGAASTVRVRGEIDIDNCQQFTEALDAAREGRRHVHVDLAEVGYMDSSGLRALLAAKTAAEADGGSLDVTGASSIVSRLFEVTGVADLLVPPT